MSDDTDPAAIARRLTKAQREALRWLGEAPQFASLGSVRSVLIETGAPQQRSIRAIMGLGLVETLGFGRYALTPLGLRVRAALAGMESSDG